MIQVPQDLKKSLNVPLLEYYFQNKNDLLFCLNEAKKLVLSDRLFLENGTKAFISFVAHYAEHQLSYLFRLVELDWVSLTKLYCLLKIPKLKEFQKNKEILLVLNKEFVSIPDEIVQAIKFKDEMKEKERQVLLKGGNEYNAIKKQIQLDKNKQKANELKKQNNNNSKKEKNKKRGKHEQFVNEWEQLQKEERLYKKFKKGKITEEEYENEVHNIDKEGGEEEGDED